MEKSNKKGNQYVTNAQYNESLEKIAKLIESETGDKKAADIVRSAKTGGTTDNNNDKDSPKED